MRGIVFVIPYLSDGGAERVCSIWANRLSSCMDVTLISFYKTNNEYYVDERVKRFFLFENREKYDSSSLFKRISILRRHLKKIPKNYVIVPFLDHTHLMTYLAAFALRRKLVYTVRNNPSIDKSRFTNFLVRRSEGLILQNEEQLEYFTKVKNSVIVYNPLNDKALGNEKHYKSPCFEIVSAGRLSEQKNYEMAISAIGILAKKGVKLTYNIYGDGPKKNDLNIFIHSSGLDDYVFLRGNISNVMDKVIDNDIFVLSSKYEGFPNALLEAMTMGMICVSTRCKTGPESIVDNGKTGFLVDVNDYESLAKTIENIYSHWAESIKVGQSARKQTIEKYNTDSSIDRLIQFINKLENIEKKEGF